MKPSAKRLSKFPKWLKISSFAIMMTIIGASLAGSPSNKDTSTSNNSVSVIQTQSPSPQSILGTSTVAETTIILSTTENQTTTTIPKTAITTTAIKPTSVPVSKTTTTITKTAAPIYTQAPQAACANRTALCKDGTCSDSKSRSGTCSHHGGVAVWYNKPVN